MDLTEREKYLLKKHESDNSKVDVLLRASFNIKAGENEEEQQYPNDIIYRKFNYIENNGEPEEIEMAISGQKSIHAMYQKIWNRNKPILKYDESEKISMEPIDDWKYIIIPEGEETPIEGEKIENGQLIYFDDEYKQKTLEEAQIVVYPKKLALPENASDTPKIYEVIIPEEEINIYTNIRTKYLPLRVYNVWNFSTCDPRYGIRKVDPERTYPGQIPGQLVYNTLHYYTDIGDLVVDFMAGGGTTQDVCEDPRVQRRCLSFDKMLEDGKPVRDFIKYHQLRDDSGNVKLPELPETPKLIFCDPPYWSMMAEDYGEGAVSELTLAEFYEFILKYAEECYKILSKDGIFAFLIQDQTEKNMPVGVEEIGHIRKCADLIEGVGFELRRTVNCPQGSQTFMPQQVIRAKKEKRMLGLRRDLLIFRK